MDTVPIFPINLGSGRAEWMVRRDPELRKILEDKTRYHFGDTKYFYYAYMVNDQGDVEVSVSYRSDSGFCQSSGPVLSHTIRPYSAEDVAAKIEERKYEIAAAEYTARQEKAWAAAVEQIKKEMFG